MNTQTAPTKDEIAALTGSDLDQAIADAGIDASTGGSTASGALSASEKRDALTAHYHEDEEDGADDASQLEPGDGAPGASAEETSSVDDENPDAPDPPHEEPTVEERRDAQLKAGETTGKLKAAAVERSNMTAAEQRAGAKGAKPSEGRVDNMTRRNDADVLQGHFCLIDFRDEEFGEDAVKAVEAMIGEGNAHVGSGDYGVYIEPGVLGEDGYPLTATVLLRDEHSCQVSSVPYGALRPTLAGGRR